MEEKRLSTERFNLHPVADSDVEDIFRGLSHPDVIQFYGVSFDTLEATKEQMKWYSNLIKTETGIWWAIKDISTGEFLGAGGLNDLIKEKQSAEIGFWLLPEYWGKGAMKEVLLEIIDHSFHALELKELVAYVETENHNCIRIMEKVGFFLKETQMNAELKGDRSIDLYVYVLRAS